ncbi:unnamed protein product [Cylindrotheca closterium]|uniref:Uncharacterized protein n=1 Tax=Cylindrotheca closterium TaxID=2856 RepID=A0AAD2GD81_9STRA|nr:unnamed protein product [Cylindrotheca closterium]
MTMLRTIQEENCANEEATSPQKVPFMKPTNQSETMPIRYSSESSSSSMPIKERFEIEDSDSDWDDENSSGNDGCGKDNSTEQTNHTDIFISPNSSSQNDPWHRLVQLQPAMPPQGTAAKSADHESFLERLGRILCNHSDAVIDTSDDTSVIVEISSSISSNCKSHDNIMDFQENGTMTSEERRQRSLKRSQEEYLLQVILAQKQDMDKLW